MFNPGSRSPEDHLWEALRTPDPALRAAIARAGLAAPPDQLSPDVRFLLLRQVYLARLAEGALEDALAVAGEMQRAGAMADLAHHDAARALRGLGRREQSRGAQRLAVRHAPVERRAFHLWTLAAWQQFDGEPHAALETLDRALGWSTRERALLAAHEAWVRLELGLRVPDLDARVEALRRARVREGYGQLLLGALAAAAGDPAAARGPLAAFVARVEASDPAKRLTLADELARARALLAGLG